MKSLTHAVAATPTPAAGSARARPAPATRPHDVVTVLPISIPVPASNHVTAGPFPVPITARPGHQLRRFAVRPPLPTGVQAKLTVSQPDDKYEQEADRVADTVMRMPEPAAVGRPDDDEDKDKPDIQTKPITGQITPLLFRQPDIGAESETREKDEEEEVQAKALLQRQPGPDDEQKRGLANEIETLHAKRAFTETPVVPEKLEKEIMRAQGQGQPLSDTACAFFGPRFGHDFSQVRIHADGQAAEMARTLNAQAFTRGPDIYFGAGRYQPHDTMGRKLLAHELTHTLQQQAGARDDGQVSPSPPVGPISRVPISIARQDMDAGVAPPRDAGLPGGVPYSPPPERVPEERTPTTDTAPIEVSPPPACTTRYTRATTFQGLVDLVRAAETRLSAAGITSTRDQVHALRGIYYGTTWSQDYTVEGSTTRNEGFQRFTRPSLDPSLSVPRDVRSILDCGLFEALRDSQDMVDGGRHVDFGHLIIALDARYDPTFASNIQYPFMMTSIDMGGAGVELVTWLGDLGGGAAALAAHRVAAPGTSASSVFTGSDYGGSINLEGDIAGFVVASGASPTAITAPTFAPGPGRLSDALANYLSPGTPGAAWSGRATTFLRMYGGTFDATTRALTNSATLTSTFAGKIQIFACNYLASRVRDGHMTYSAATSAASHVIPASVEVATAFVGALADSHLNGGRIEATRFPAPRATSPGACSQQLRAAGLLGTFGL